MRAFLILCALGLWFAGPLSPSADADDHCWVLPNGEVQCNVTGTIPIPGEPPVERPPGERPPIRYLVLGVDATGTDCYWWSRVPVPGAIDVWDPANDPTTITTLISYPECTSPPVVPAVNPTDRAWEVYRSWTLQLPVPQFSPPDFGVTGLATFVEASAARLDHLETLPSGIDLVVSAEVTGVTVDWGDGSPAERYSPTETVGYPNGVAAHTYELKTCTAEYRDTDPNGHLCHPTLSAYPVTVTFTWTAGYSYDAGWIELESVNRTATIAYDVDEVVGVPQG